MRCSNFRYREDPQGVGHGTVELFNEVQIEAARTRHSIEVWRDQLNGESAPQYADELIDGMRSILEYLSVCPRPATVAARVWAILYLVRPELIGYETLKSAAVRFNCSAFALQHNCNEFRALFPSVRFPSRPGGINRTAYKAKNRISPEVDLSSYLRDTVHRLQRIAREAGWKFLGDVRPDTFLNWRSSLIGSAKTVKEYQVSLNAFLNHLVMVERLERNPLSKIRHVDIRGKQVRPYRSFSDDELRKLFAVAGDRLVVYQVMLYTGQRPEEVAALVWGDFNFDEDKPFVLVREGTTKDKDKRAVPLHPGLASVLRVARSKAVDGSAAVFPHFPTRRTLLADLVRASIERKDGLGRTLHLRSFRKTWQTLGVRYGINQRSAQAVLGHSDANLTANVYTDVPALALHEEIAKLPWFGGGADNAQVHALIEPENLTIRQLVLQLFEAVKVHSTEGNKWSGRQDSNLRPPGPKPGALPG